MANGEIQKNLEKAAKLIGQHDDFDGVAIIANDIENNGCRFVAYHTSQRDLANMAMALLGNLDDEVLKVVLALTVAQRITKDEN